MQRIIPSLAQAFSHTRFRSQTSWESELQSLTNTRTSKNMTHLVDRIVEMSYMVRIMFCPWPIFLYVKVISIALTI